ncbi:hypothetical protein NLJ89_g10415 [Agrocybe chaxingu]|uniref:Uncharacterized protein n=1 Tax=Agrocybe chaxingu TaxID=84603 RepID=A0A9W8JNX8_9AGAR|nr:hypothetical protein NLJ89_g10415 [Agrocybe chaxingu]
MAFLPFSLSYILLTPGRVRLPGEVPPAPPSPSRPRIRRTSKRLSTDLTNKARSLRSLVGGKSGSPTKYDPVKSDEE